MYTENTHEVDPCDNTMVRDSRLEILAYTGNPHEYRPAEVVLILENPARSTKQGAVLHNRFFQKHAGVHLLKVVLGAVEVVCYQELQQSSSRQDNQYKCHNRKQMNTMPYYRILLGLRHEKRHPIGKRRDCI